MKKILMMAVALVCLTACAPKQKGEQRGPRHGGGMEINKDSDSTFVALKNEALAKFKQSLSKMLRRVRRWSTT